MNNNLSIKYWSDGEELQLIDEINKLTDINVILQNHNRKITGILMRIEKILNDPIKLVKIFNKNEIVDKYLTNTKNKYFISYDELYINILKFNSLEEISNNYNKLSLTKIKSILNDFLKKNDIDVAKKLRINCLLKTKENLDLAEKTFHNDNNINNINKNNIKNIHNNYNGNNTKNYTKNYTENNNEDNNNNVNDNNINSIIILLLDEIKMMRTDVFDIKNRVKVIMDKVNILEKKNKDDVSSLKNNILTKNLDLKIFNDNNSNYEKNINETIKTTKEKKNKDKKIKIIVDNHLNKMNQSNDLSDNNDELDKEFEKILE